MEELAFKSVSSSNTTPVDNTRRKDVKIANAPICWMHKIVREISIGDEMYAKRYAMDGKLVKMDHTIEFTLGIRTDVEPVVLVLVRFDSELGLDDETQKNYDAIAPADPKFATSRAAAAKVISTVTENFLAAVNKGFNNRFKIEITDPACGVKVMPIKYKAIFDEAAPHYTIKAFPTYPREMVSEMKVYLSTVTDDETHVHEFAHCIGLPDEYSYSEVNQHELVQYVKPDGTMDAPIVALPPNSFTEKLEVLMSSGKPIFSERHAWPIAIETQRALSEETGRKIRCRILLA